MPPPGVTVAPPSAKPLQLALESKAQPAVRIVGSVIVMEQVSVQLLKSLTVTVYIPAARFIAEAFDWPLLQL